MLCKCTVHKGNCVYYYGYVHLPSMLDVENSVVSVEKSVDIVMYGILPILSFPAMESVSVKIWFISHELA